MILNAYCFSPVEAGIEPEGVGIGGQYTILVINASLALHAPSPPSPNILVNIYNIAGAARLATRPVSKIRY
jgi:hypothetical protein